MKQIVGDFMNDECVFCRIAHSKEAEVNMIYESQLVACFLDIEPINEGHILIIPKSHSSDLDELMEDVIIEIMRISRKILKALKQVYEFPGYSMMQNGGEFCDFGHYHMHIFPRYHGDGFGWTCGEENLRGDSRNSATKIKQALFNVKM